MPNSKVTKKIKDLQVEHKDYVYRMSAVVVRIETLGWNKSEMGRFMKIKRSSVYSAFTFNTVSLPVLQKSEQILKLYDEGRLKEEVVTMLETRKRGKQSVLDISELVK